MLLKYKKEVQLWKENHRAMEDAIKERLILDDGMSLQWPSYAPFHMINKIWSLALSLFDFVFVLMIKKEEIWSSAFIKSPEGWWLLRTVRLSTRPLCSALYLLCHKVTPKHFYFAVLTLTANRGICGRNEISQTVVPPIVSQMFVEANWMARCLVL